MIKLMFISASLVVAIVLAVGVDSYFAQESDTRVYLKVLNRVPSLEKVTFSPSEYLQLCESYTEFLVYRSKSCVSATSIVRVGEGRKNHKQKFSLQYIPPVGVLSFDNILWGKSRTNRFPESAVSIRVFEREHPETHIKKEN